ncbi:MAG: ion transporter [Pseudoclavibacter sp.]
MTLSPQQTDATAGSAPTVASGGSRAATPSATDRPTRLARVRATVGAWVESRAVQNVIITVIIANAVTLGMQTSDGIMRSIGGAIHAIDAVFLGIFVVELACKLFARGWKFFTDGWNIFDFLIVAIALVPTSGAFSVLRALRVLRVLRLVSVVPQLRFIVTTLLAAIPGIASIGALLSIIFYVAAVMATELFGDVAPEQFGTIGESLFTLFQMMTLDSWAAVVRPIMADGMPGAWVFFVLFIVVSALTMLNLFVAVIIDTMQNLAKGREERAGEATQDDADTPAVDTPGRPDERSTPEHSNSLPEPKPKPERFGEADLLAERDDLTDEQLASELAMVRSHLDTLTTALERRSR